MQREEPMPIYNCPECGKKLKTSQPVPAGKKLKCPECETVFPVRGEAAAKSKPTPAAAPAAPPERGGEDETGGIYHFQEAKEEEWSEEQRQKVFDPVKDRFVKSKRGPAQATVVKASDWLLRSGIGVCVAAIFGFMIAGWPLVFKIEEVQVATGKAKYSEQGKKRYKEVTADERNTRFLYMGAFVLLFFWGCVICMGASKMHQLEVYWLAMAASVMTLVNPLTPLGIWLIYENYDSEDKYYALLGVIGVLAGVPLCAWCIALLRKKLVIEGFAEERQFDWAPQV